MLNCDDLRLVASFQAKQSQTPIAHRKRNEVVLDRCLSCFTSCFLVYHDMVLRCWSERKTRRFDEALKFAVGRHVLRDVAYELALVFLE